TESGRFIQKLVRAWRAFATKLALLLLIFVAVPIILYSEFRSADEEKQRLLLQSTQEQGRLIAGTLKPLLKGFDPGTVQQLGDVLGQISSTDTNIKVLFR